MTDSYWIGGKEYVPDEPIKEKFCSRCGTYKPLEQFYKRGKKSTYYAGYCKSCHTKPFKHEKIRCPHCKECITFFGVDHKGEIIKGKNDVLVKLKKQLKKEKKFKDKESKEVKEVKTDKPKKNVRDIL